MFACSLSLSLAVAAASAAQCPLAPQPRMCLMLLSLVGLARSVPHCTCSLSLPLLLASQHGAVHRQAHAGGGPKEVGAAAARERSRRRHASSNEEGEREGALRATCSPSDPLRSALLAVCAGSLKRFDAARPGMAFVTYESESSAEACLRDLQDHEIIPGVK